MNEEAVRIDSIDVSGGTITLGRGCLDTYPRAHNINDVIYFADDNNASPTTVYTAGGSLDAKALTQTSVGVLDIGDATEISATFIGRQNKPYLPSQIKINSIYFPTAFEGPIIPLSWEHQDRLQQVAGIEDWYNVALGAQETDVTYTVRFYNDDTSTLMQTVTGITGKTLNLVTTAAIGSAFNGRIEVESIRNGESSYQIFQHVLAYTNPVVVRITETGDTRIAENNDRRIAED